jgi:hypothetical protein
MVVSKVESDPVAGVSVTVIWISTFKIVSQNPYSSFTIRVPHVLSINVSLYYDS